MNGQSPSPVRPVATSTTPEPVRSSVGARHGGLRRGFFTEVNPTRIVYLALIAVTVIGWGLVAADGGNFLTLETVVGIQQRSAALGIVAVGQTLAILVGSLDLSVAYLISLGSLVAAEIMAGHDGGVVPAILAVLGVSALVGLVNGLVITRLQVHAFIATLGTALILKGVIDHRYDGPAGSVPESFQRLGYDRLGPVPVSALLWVAVAVTAWFLLRRTPWATASTRSAGTPTWPGCRGCVPAGSWCSPTFCARCARASPACCWPAGWARARPRSAPTADTTWSRSPRLCSAAPR